MRMEIIEDTHYTIEDLMSFDVINVAYSSSRHTLGNQRLSPSAIHAITQDKDYWWRPVYAYVHGGATVSMHPFSDPWDSGQSGIVYGLKSAIAEASGHKRWCAATVKSALHIAEGVVKELDLILQGEVYGYAIYNDNDELVDSCHGFVGREWAEESGQDALSHWRS